MATQEKQPSPRRKPAGWILALTGIVVVALQPLLGGLLPWRGDGLLHYYRLTQLARAVAAAPPWPRWAPDLGYGFGFPLFNFYAPLSYYLALPPLWLGLGAATALRLVYGLAILALSLFLFLWTRSLSADRGRNGVLAGLIAAAAGVFAPYFLTNVYHRAALAEVWGLVFLAAALTAAARLARRPGRSAWLALTAAYAALLLTHNILALVGTPLLLAYGAWLWLTTGRSRRLALQLLAAGGAALLLTAFFWLPAFIEKEFVQIERLYASSNFAYENNFSSLSELLARPRSADPLRVNPPLPLSVGWPALLLAALGLLPPARSAAARSVRRSQAALAIALLAALFMALPISKFIWDAVPLLRFVQFPWRFVGPATLLLAPLAGLGALRLAAHAPRALLPFSGGALLALLLFGLPWLFPAGAPPPATPLPADLIRFEQRSGALGATSAGDYLPTTVQQLPPADALLARYDTAGSAPIARLNPETLPAEVVVVDARYALLSADLQLRAAQEALLTFDWFYFPGWRARIDGAKVPVSPSAPFGLLQVTVPAGTHTLTVDYAGTPLQRAAAALSAAALILCAAALWLPRRWWEDDRPVTTCAAPPFPRRWGAALLGGGLLLLGLKSAWLDLGDTLFRSTRLAGVSVAAATPLGPVNFGNQLALLAIDLPALPVPADGSVHLTLFWQALLPVTAEYSVSVRLVDETGRLYGQDDSMHPAGIPVPRWRAGEYAHDQHQLALLPGTPPGDYALEVTVYPTAGGPALETLAPDRRPTGLAQQVGSVRVTPPEKPLDVAALPFALSAAAPLGDSVMLLGWDPPASRVTVGEALDIRLYWGATGTPTRDYRVELLLRDESGAAVAYASKLPGRDSFPTTFWEAGTVVRDDWRIFVPAVGRDGAAMDSGAYRLVVRLLLPDGSPPGAEVPLGSVTVIAPQRSFLPPAPAVPLAAQLGEFALLTGFDLQPAGGGGTATLTLYWQAVAPTATAYTVFVQLLDAAGRILLQRDSQPLAGQRPTTGWLPGEYLTDVYQLPLPTDLPAPPYHLIVGLYDPATGARLPVIVDGTPQGDFIILGSPLTP